ncbi:hypothetical protein SISNIDRAFT_413347, partial [Sistotremastrum niveocremeum HHB9708]
RGFNYDPTGKLLCPFNKVWEDPLVQQGLRDKTINPKATAWPLLLYADAEFDKDDPFRGIFRNKGLIEVCKYVFLGPSSVAGAVHSQSTRRSNADIHSMTTISAPVIAYCCVLVCHPLSRVLLQALITV